MLKNVGLQLLMPSGAYQVFIGESHDERNVVMVLKYPPRKAFLQMISGPACNWAHKHHEGHSLILHFSLAPLWRLQRKPNMPV